jgi:hypothetical protein
VEESFVLPVKERINWRWHGRWWMAFTNTLTLIRRVRRTCSAFKVHESYLHVCDEI